MSNILHLLSEETFSEKMDQQAAILAAIASKNGGLTVQSWSDLQQLVRKGLVAQVLSIGDQLSCNKGETKLIWDVIGIDHDTPTDSTKTHSMTLQLHECITDFPFDGQEAFYYSAGGLTAGTYNFTVGEHIYVPSDVGKTYQFTLAQPLPAGGQIVFGAAYNVSFDGTYISTYSGGSSTTAIETAQITSGTGGTNLGTINNAINGGLNAILRALLGSNNYGQSALRQYLNSNAAAGSVWTPKNNFDRPPAWATTTAGFLNGMDEDFLSVVGNVDKITALNTISDGGGSVTTSEKFFLLSRSEVYGGDAGGIAEGAAYSYYSGNSDLSAAGMGADTNRIKYRGIARYWFLRTPVVSSSTSEMAVDQKGNVVGANTGGSIGIAPACCIV